MNKLTVAQQLLHKFNSNLSISKLNQDQIAILFEVGSTIDLHSKNGLSIETANIVEDVLQLNTTNSTTTSNTSNTANTTNVTNFANSNNFLNVNKTINSNNNEQIVYMDIDYCAAN